MILFKYIKSNFSYLNIYNRDSSRKLPICWPETHLKLNNCIAVGRRPCEAEVHSVSPVVCRSLFFIALSLSQHIYTLSTRETRLDKVVQLTFQQRCLVLDLDLLNVQSNNNNRVLSRIKHTTNRPKYNLQNKEPWPKSTFTKYYQ